MREKAWRQKLNRNLSRGLIIKAVKEEPLRFKELEEKIKGKMSKQILAVHLRKLTKEKILEKQFDAEKDAVVYGIVGQRKADQIIRALKRQVKFYQDAFPSVEALIKAKWHMIEEEAAEKK